MFHEMQGTTWAKPFRRPRWSWEDIIKRVYKVQKGFNRIKKGINGRPLRTHNKHLRSTKCRGLHGQNHLGDPDGVGRILLKGYIKCRRDSTGSR
jgi:hypothetical protein